MKKVIVIILTLIVMFLIYDETKEKEIIIPDTAIRLRVIPNSNSPLDQNMKNKVKNYLEENTYKIIKDEEDIDEARYIIQNNIPNIEENIQKIFDQNNYQMDYKVNYGYNYFPDKEYRGVKYEEGYYESIVISIGKAEGDNWWCVLFPNLCLADLEKGNDVEYKSWILEKLDKIF
ncbi:MAG: stage II sporulation protein R [Bacilli bacterium]